MLLLYVIFFLLKHNKNVELFYLYADEINLLGFNWAEIRKVKNVFTLQTREYLYIKTYVPL